MISLRGLQEAADLLARLRVEQARDAALESAAKTLETAARRVAAEPVDGQIRSSTSTESELPQSVLYTVSGREAIVGATSELALTRDLGTNTAPPQPFLLPAAVAASDEIVEPMTSAVAAALGG
jgi:hypothetical protein